MLGLCLCPSGFALVALQSSCHIRRCPLESCCRQRSQSVQIHAFSLDFSLGFVLAELQPYHIVSPRQATLPRLLPQPAGGFTLQISTLSDAKALLPASPAVSGE